MIDKQQIKAVGFDVDGTLYHTPDAMGAHVGKILIQKAAEALSQDPDDLAEEYLRRREEYRSNTATLNSFGLEGEKIFQEVWNEIAIEKYVERDEKLVEVIKILNTKYKLFIISNGTGTQIERKLALLGLNYHDFEPRIYCYDHDWVKPDPAPFLAAVESLGLKPEQTAYVGDREDIDIEGATALGMKTIYVGQKSTKADASIEVVYDIVSIL
jgi:HAD superfamily hydrolase (TIGR01549 family)